MARIPMTNGFMIIPEGLYVFCVYGAKYDDDFGKLEVDLVNAQGMTMKQKYNIKNTDDEYNEKALNAFSYFAKTVMNDYSMEDIDPKQLIGHYVEATVTHTEAQSTKDPSKTVTFANLGDISPADGFDTEISPRTRKLCGMSDLTNAPATTPAPSKKGLDLDALLG